MEETLMLKFLLELLLSLGFFLALLHQPFVEQPLFISNIRVEENEDYHQED
jgi:hypothetical protein